MSDQAATASWARRIIQRWCRPATRTTPVSGLIRATGENLSPGGNRDSKQALNERGRTAVRRLHFRAPSQENVLIRLPEPDVAAIFAGPSGAATGERAVPVRAADAGQPDTGL